MDLNELDKLIHAKVMGLIVDQICEGGDTLDYDGDYLCGICGFSSHDWEDSSTHIMPIPKYSANIDAAVTVLAKFKAWTLACSDNYGKLTYTARIYPKYPTLKSISTDAETAPLAVCLLMIKALGIEYNVTTTER
jgi:hypothetical protein